MNTEKDASEKSVTMGNKELKSGFREEFSKEDVVDILFDIKSDFDEERRLVLASLSKGTLMPSEKARFIGLLNKISRSKMELFNKLGMPALSKIRSDEIDRLYGGGLMLPHR